MVKAHNHKSNIWVTLFIGIPVASIVFMLLGPVLSRSVNNYAFAEPQPVRWTPFIKIKSINDIEQAIDEYNALATLKSHVNTDDLNAYLLTRQFGDN
jgi:hypothetical protein